MAQDAKGHGSEKRSDMAWSDEARAAAAAARANSLKAGASPGVATGHGHFAAAMTELMSGQQHTQALADQHGIDTSHLNAQGHEWGSPEALADFKAQYGGPRDLAAEQRSFNSGAREINRLKRQGK